MMIYFGENLKKLRKQREMTQEVLADFLGVSFQAVSKWERGETYPDMTMLPAIASLFNVTTDFLLGIDKVNQETKIQQYISDYNEYWRNGNLKEVENRMKEAVTEFPGDFRLLSRYLNVIVCNNRSDEEIVAVKKEVISIYENIQAYCTDDSIRIWTKKLICGFFRNLSKISGSDISLEDAEKILAQMPLMQNSRDYIAVSFYPPGEKNDTACKNAVSELVYLLDNAISHLCYFDTLHSYKYKIEAAEAVLALHKAMFPDDDHGKSWLNVIYAHINLGQWYFAEGDIENSLNHLRKGAELAKTFDKLPDELQHTSLLVEGIKIKKDSLPTSHGNVSMCNRMNEIIERHQYTDDFRNSDKFQEIIKILRS